MLCLCPCWSPWEKTSWLMPTATISGSLSYQVGHDCECAAYALSTAVCNLVLCVAASQRSSVFLWPRPQGADVDSGPGISHQDVSHLRRGSCPSNSWVLKEYRLELGTLEVARVLCFRWWRWFRTCLFLSLPWWMVSPQRPVASLLPAATSPWWQKSPPLPRQVSTLVCSAQRQRWPLAGPYHGR